MEQAWHPKMYEVDFYFKTETLRSGSFQVVGSYKASSLVATPLFCKPLRLRLMQACFALAFSFSLFKGGRLLASSN